MLSQQMIEMSEIALGTQSPILLIPSRPSCDMTLKLNPQIDVLNFVCILRSVSSFSIPNAIFERTESREDDTP